MIDKSAQIRKKYRWIALCIAVIAITRLPTLLEPILNIDEADFAVQTAVWMDGGKPYIDFVEKKPPLIHMAYALAFEAGGVSDIKRIDSILGWWQIVDKSFIVNKYYILFMRKILIQGSITEWTSHVINEFTENFPDAEILLSTWNDEDVKDIECNIIQSEKPEKTFPHESNINFQELTIKEVMTRNCKSIGANKPALKALEMMEKFSLNSLPVVDSNNQIVGALNMHTLMQAKLF